MKKEVIITEKAPKALGPYSQAIIAGSWLFISGQGAIDPQTQIYTPMSIKEETRLALNNLKAIVEHAGASLENVVKTTIFLEDMNDFQEFNKIYAEYFTQNPPARSTIQAAKLPKGFKVEIEAIVLIA
ncbi:MAG TPA: RidA family protein [Caldisericia bacterium]|nr:RidA family protein [Caldisericia bacterium]